MTLAVGDQALPFSTTDLTGQRVALEQFRGQPVLSMFFRYASCPMCNLRLHDFARAYPRLQEICNLAAVAFFHSSAKAIASHSGRRRYPFALVPDPRQTIYRNFGVTRSWAGLLTSTALPGFYPDWIRAMRHGFWGGVDWEMATMPADFLVDPGGRLILVHYGRTIGDHLAAPTIEAALTVQSAR